MLERTIDLLAADLDIDPIDMRRRNALGVDAFPHSTATGLMYDSGDHRALLDALVLRSDYRALREEQRARRAAGAIVGVGVALVVDSTAWFSRDEAAAVAVEPDGTVVVRAGSAPSGQRHHVAYREVVRALLPVPPEQIRVIEGDTDVWDASAGTMGSRTAQLAGTAIHHATTKLVDELRQLAASALEADVSDIVFHAATEGRANEGRASGFRVRGVPASARTLAELVAHAQGAVETSCAYQQVGATYPSAAHLSVVEIDGETGQARATRHVAVTDCGRVLDHASATGQVVGATVQGIAQALYEEAVYDAEGTPLTTSFADYGIPSAADVPPIETHFLQTPSPHNPLGAKGVGEIGMLAAPVAVLNAVVDALRPFGVRHLDMPCTPARIWAALRS
jgi:carbon-monoxide dehydrogenase large subunit